MTMTDTRPLPTAGRAERSDPLQVRDPVRLAAGAAPWRAAGYLLTYLPFGALCFALTLGALLAGGILSITWVGLPVLALALVVVRALAAAERGRAGVVGGVAAPVRHPTRPGLLPALADRVRDPGTWREVVLLLVLWPYLLTVDLVAIVLGLIGPILVSLPFWYRYIPNPVDGHRYHGIVLGWYPHGPFADPHYGFLIRDMHSALVAAGAGLVVWLLIGQYVVLGAARHHRRIARALLAG